jgi:hypothetical protein
VVVVVVGPGTVVCCEVLVVLCVSVPLLQAVSDTRTAAIRHGMMSFFISIIFVWFVTLPCETTQLIVICHGV